VQRALGPHSAGCFQRSSCGAAGELQMAIVRRDGICVAGLAIGLLFVAGKAIAAESTKWLIENPVSMMDWGSAEAKKSAQSAADLLNKFMEQRAKQDYDFENDKSIPDEVKKRTLEDRKRWAASYPKQYGYHYGPGYAGYDVRRDRILVGVFVAPVFIHPGKIDAESCAGIVEDFREQLLSPAASPQQLVTEFWFTHNGYKSDAMPANFERDLTEHVTVVVHLDRYATLDSAVTCEQPLQGGSITSVIKKRPE
jgi:hypothetical protein